MGAVSKFEQSVGKSLSLVHFAAPFADCSSSPCSFYDFPDRLDGRHPQTRRDPLLQLELAVDSRRSSNEPDFQLSDVIAGTYDAYIRSFAEAASDWGHPFFLRFDWEMNGNWFPWAEGVNGNQPGEYVAAWRHVHDIFTSVGATNATWVWCPNVDPGQEFSDLASLYPGDEYVDWTGLDGYNWGTNPVRPARWMSFDQLFGSTYHRIADTIAPRKPMVIGEVGSTEYGGSKAAWISGNACRRAHRVPSRFAALLWFDKYVPGEDMDWPIDSSVRRHRRLRRWHPEPLLPRRRLWLAARRRPSRRRADPARHLLFPKLPRALVTSYPI